MLKQIPTNALSDTDRSNAGKVHNSFQTKTETRCYLFATQLFEPVFKLLLRREVGCRAANIPLLQSEVSTQQAPLRYLGFSCFPFWFKRANAR